MFVMDCLSVNDKGRLAIGGADVTELAREYGTPLYILDEDKIRDTCAKYKNALLAHYGENAIAAYASKTFSAKYIYKLVSEEGMGSDVVSGGELYTAMCAGFNPKNIFFHGNNKTAEEITYALDCGVGRIVVDNRDELLRLDKIAGGMRKRCEISFRIKPGIDAHTHDFIQTGKIDSKFGVALETGEAFAIIKEAAALKNVEVVGIHCHIGSQIFDTEPFEHAAEVMVSFMAEVKEKLGVTLRELNLGGGFGIRYIDSHDPKMIEESVEKTASAVKKAAKKHGVVLPRLVLEPGRSITGPAGITVYTVGSVKEIPNVRTYAAVDGGMTDNPRYALYEAAYDALLPERPLAKREKLYTIAGRCCESGDLLAKDIKMPEIKAGELLCVLATGAYNYSMASNYNRVPRPPVVMVSGGKARLIVKRESYEDIVKNDIL